MNKLYLILIGIGLCLSLCFTGCLTTSIFPFYERADLVENNEFLGEWVSPRTIWTVTKGKGMSYTLTYKECADPINEPSNYTSCTAADFQMHLIKIGADYYADFMPINYSNTDNQFLLFHLRPVHSFAKVAIIDGELQITFIDNDWIKDYLKKQPDAIEHIVIDKGVIFTATTPKLKAFVEEMSVRDDVFTIPLELRRRNTWK